MLIVAIDTSGRSGSLALAEGDLRSFHILELVPLAAGMFSAQLIPQLSTLLVRHGFAKDAIGGYCVVSGPGSFTGLRVGLSTVKALAEISGKPIAAISALELVAWAANDGGRVLAALDAVRSQVFLGEYEVGNGGSLRIREWLATMEELVELRSQQSAIPLVTPDESVVRALQAHGMAGRLIPQPQADAVALIGLGKLIHGVTVAPEELDANYIRRSDAELFSLPRRS